MSEPFNDLKQIEMYVAAAKKMVGSATMSMDPEQLDDASSAIADARKQLNSVKHHTTGVDDQFLERQEALIEECEHQLNEARQ